MSSRTSSRSTLTMVPSTMSPSLKYLMVSSIAARKASSEPMSLTATCGVVGAASVLLVMWEWAPNTDTGVWWDTRARARDRPAEVQRVGVSDRQVDMVERGLLRPRSRRPAAHRSGYGLYPTMVNRRTGCHPVFRPNGGPLEDR